MNESMDRLLADWLREGPETGPREGLERALAATRRVGQTPGWALPERWLPMQLTMARTPSLRPILAIVTVALLTLALVAAALFIGSQRRPLPAPFGPARNGAVVYAESGDLFLADELSGEARALVSGPETDSYPVFANQGDRLAFVRETDGGFQVMSVNPDGSDLRSLGELPGGLERMTWSPDGTSLLVSYSETDYKGLTAAVVNADGSGLHELATGMTTDYATWRPDSSQIVFRGHDLEADTSSAYIVDADGTNLQRLDIPSQGDVDFEGMTWSPDGKHLSFMSAGELSGLTGWQINVADIGADGSVTALHPLRFDEDADEEYYPSWSPDSRQLAFMRQKDLRRQVGIANADGTDFRLVGPETVTPYMLGPTWSPDGKTLVITEIPDFEPLRESQRKMWTVDVATGAYEEVQTPVATWQRLAP
jgi:Tol biopolymer transport system component